MDDVGGPILPFVFLLNGTGVITDWEDGWMSTRMTPSPAQPSPTKEDDRHRIIFSNRQGSRSRTIAPLDDLDLVG